MEFQRIDRVQTADGKPVPAYLVLPENPIGGTALCHGYGGSKEEMLGLGARLAEAGVAALCFDLRGHGENPALLDGRMLDDFEAAIGHSLGGAAGSHDLGRSGHRHLAGGRRAPF